ncbi:hypothetical protein BD626DRAFT_84632 [Schizophyllum amplum]|uniref:Uncharacterized protein n=1 Tax=Schizophyllum amplum TaxID=97359 RepID=A0A550C907_9AGAR|nr:hypothetical protein BD626DRAFT_84632 [Auriculariopsis ampla]
MGGPAEPAGRLYNGCFAVVTCPFPFTLPPIMAGDGGRKRDKGKAPAGGTADREHTPAKPPPVHDGPPTPPKNTPYYRTPDNRERTIRRAGIEACLMTGLLDGLSLQCFHAVARSLARTHSDIYKRFRNSVGLWVKKNGRKVRVLNLDTTANMELLADFLHRLFDGPSVRRRYGQGIFALVPVNLAWCLKRIKDNPDMPYPELFPESTYEYTIVVFTNGTNRRVSRHASFRRTYAHALLAEKHDSKDESDEEYITDDEDNEEDDEAEDSEDDQDDEDDEDDEDGSEHDEDTKSSDLNDQKDEDEDDSSSDLEPMNDPNVIDFFLNRGVPELDVPMLSHLNPVFPIFDFAMKMRTRVSKKQLERQLSPEQRQFYSAHVEHAVKHWFEAPKVAVGGLKDFSTEDDDPQSKRKARQKAKSTIAAKAAPMASVQKRVAKTTPAAGSSRAPPASPAPPAVAGLRRSQRTGVRARTPEGARKLRSRTVPAASTGSKRTPIQASITDEDQPPKKRARKANTRG